MADEMDVALRRCLALQAAGDLAGALAAAREAEAAGQDSPVPHYAQGVICRQLGDDAGAVLAFGAAVRFAPGWADAWVNLGLARYGQGAVWSAKMAMREALRVEPGHAAAASNLGALMRISGEPEAEAVLREALARAPGNAGARLNLAAALLHGERGQEALALLEAPSALPEWQLARVMALLQLGRAAAARAALAGMTVPDALAPLLHWRHVLLAQLEGDAPAALNAARAMDASIPQMGPDAVPEHRIMAHYDLAQFFSGRSDPASAFAHWGAGHSLLRMSQPFSRAGFLKFIDSTIEHFDAARFAGARAGNLDPAPVFIVGMPRSGTSLCEQILAAHRDVHGAGERDALAPLAARLGEGLALDAAALDAAAAEYLAELHALAPEKKRIVDKMPGNELHLGLVGLMMPGARIIHCVRDPRDIGFSIWTFRFHGEHPYAHDLADLGWTIAQRDRLMAHWRNVLPNRILTVALHDWVRDFEGTLAKVLSHLDLPPDAACERFYESEREVRTVSRAQVREPVHGRGLGRWRVHAEHLTPLIAELDAAGMLEGWDPA